jgi:hypothetical protein
MTRNTLFLSWPLSRRRELAGAIDAERKAWKAAWTKGSDAAHKAHREAEGALFGLWPKDGRKDGLVLYRGKLLDRYLNEWSGVVPLDDGGGGGGD